MSPKTTSKQIPSSRLSLGMTGRVRDIVAFFPQGEPKDPTQLRIQEHVNQSNRKVFSVVESTPKREGSKHIGMEEPAGEGYEYLLAIVDKRTGKAIEFRPTALVNFQPRYKPSKEILAGKKRRHIVDYSKDFTTAKDAEKARDERRRLTANFGSVKKNKMLEANIRRSITTDTLKAMTSTAFSSAASNAVATKQEAESDDSDVEKKPKDQKKAAVLSILQQSTSSVLPAPNYEAKQPSDVYTFEQFLPKDYDDKSRDEYEIEAIAFFREYDTFQKLAQSAIPPLAAKRVGTPLRYANPGQRCVLALKMVTLAKFVQMVFKRSLPMQWVNVKELESLEVPPKILNHLRVEYLGYGKSAGMQVKVHIPSQEKHRAVADLLCLLLLFDEPEFLLPLSPMVQELGPNENVLKTLLTGLGCIVTVASETQALTMNTIRVARLVGPPKKESNVASHSKRGGRR